MVKDDKGCNVGVEHLGIAEILNPHVVHNSPDEDLDATLSGLVSLVVLNQGTPGGFGTNAVNERSFRVDCRVIAGQSGGWVYEGSTIVVDIAIRAGNKSPEVVDAVDAVVGGLEWHQRDGRDRRWRAVH
jgi:hypothetical protein